VVPTDITPTITIPGWFGYGNGGGGGDNGGGGGD
jgi:hypothetical protein